LYDTGQKKSKNDPRRPVAFLEKKSSFYAIDKMYGNHGRHYEIYFDRVISALK